MQHVLVVCLLSGLCGAKTLIHTEGGSVTVKCSFTFSGGGKFLCRDPCKDGDVLIETEAAEHRRGRYGIRYKEGTFPASSTDLYVSISQLTPADSGRYRCGLKRRFMLDSQEEFNIRVIAALEAPPDGLKQQTEGTGASEGQLSILASRSGFILSLVFCVAAALFAATVLLLYKWKTTRESDGSTSRAQLSCRNNTGSRTVQVGHHQAGFCLN
ncbi:uncharacterized protein V3H82_010449 [Fundulus diaphanus]